MDNPYEAPRTLPQFSVRPTALSVRTQVAFIAAAIGFVVLFNYLQLIRVPSGRPIMIWPTLTVPFVFSILSAVRSRYAILPALSAALGIISVVPVFAAFRGWDAAEPHIILPIAIALSIPSFLVAKSTRVRLCF